MRHVQQISVTDTYQLYCTIPVIFITVQTCEYSLYTILMITYLSQICIKCLYHTCILHLLTDMYIQFVYSTYDNTSVTDPYNRSVPYLYCISAAQIRIYNMYFSGSVTGCWCPHPVTDSWIFCCVVIVVLQSQKLTFDSHTKSKFLALWDYNFNYGMLWMTEISAWSWVSLLCSLYVHLNPDSHNLSCSLPWP